MTSHPPNSSFSGYAGPGRHTQALHPPSLMPGFSKPRLDGNANITYDRQSQLDVTIGSAEHVFTCLRGGRGLACAHFPKYTAGTPTLHREYPSRLGFFHASYSNGFISYLETAKFCSNCLDQVVPNGYTYWTMMPAGDGRAIEGRCLDTTMSSQMYPRLYQAGTERFDQTTVRPQSVPDNLITQPKEIPIPEIAEALDAWRWMQSQRKPFYIDALHLTNGWTPFAELSAQEDARIVRRSGQPFTMNRSSGAIENFAKPQVSQDHSPLPNMSLSLVQQPLCDASTMKANHKQSTMTTGPTSMGANSGITTIGASSIARKAVPGLSSRPDLPHVSSVPDMHRRAGVAASTATYQTVLMTKETTSADARIRPTSTNGMRAVSQPGIGVSTNVNQRTHALVSSNRPGHGSLQDLKHASAGLQCPQSSHSSTSMPSRPVPSPMPMPTGDVKPPRAMTPSHNTIITTGTQHSKRDQNSRSTEGSINPPPRQASKPTNGKGDHMPHGRIVQGSTGQSSITNSGLHGSVPGSMNKPPGSTKHRTTSWYRHDPIDFDELDSAPAMTGQQQLPQPGSKLSSPLPTVLVPGSGSKSDPATRGLDTARVAELFQLFEPNAETRQTETKAPQKTANKVTTRFPPRHPDRTKKPVPAIQSVSKETTKKTAPQVKQTPAAQKGLQAAPPNIAGNHLQENQPPRRAQAAVGHRDLQTSAPKSGLPANHDRLRSSVDTWRQKTSTPQGSTKPKLPTDKLSDAKATKPTRKRESDRAGPSTRKGPRASGKDKISRLRDPKPHKPPGKGSKSNGLTSTPGKHGGNSSHITNTSSMTNSTTNTTIHVIGADSDESNSEQDTTSGDQSEEEANETGESPDDTDVHSSAPSSPIGSPGQHLPGHDAQSNLDNPLNNDGVPGQQQPESAPHPLFTDPHLGGQTPDSPGHQAQVHIHGQGIQLEAGMDTVASASSSQSGYMQQSVSGTEYEQGERPSFLPSKGDTPYDDQHWNPAPSWPSVLSPEGDNHQVGNPTSLSLQTPGSTTDTNNLPQPDWRASGIGATSDDSSFPAPVGTKPQSTQGLAPVAPVYVVAEQQHSVPVSVPTGGWRQTQAAPDVASYGHSNDRKDHIQDAMRMPADQPGPSPNQVKSTAWSTGTGQGMNQSCFSPTNAQPAGSSYDPWAPQTRASQQSRDDPWGGPQPTNVLEPNSAWDSRAEPMSPGPSAKPRTSSIPAWRTQDNLPSPSPNEERTEDWPNWSNRNNAPVAEGPQASQVSIWQTPAPYIGQNPPTSPYVSQPTFQEHQPFTHEGQPPPKTGSKTKGLAAAGLGLAAGAAIGYGLASLSRSSSASSKSSKTSSQEHQDQESFGNQLWGLSPGDNGILNNDPSNDLDETESNKSSDSSSSSDQGNMGWSPQEQRLTSRWNGHIDSSSHYSNIDYDGEADRNDSQNFGDQTMTWDQSSPTDYNNNNNNNNNNNHVSSPSSESEQTYTNQDALDNVYEFGGWPGEGDTYQESYHGQSGSENEGESDSEGSAYEHQIYQGYEPQDQYFQHQRYALEADQSSEGPEDEQSDAQTDDQDDSDTEANEQYEYGLGNGSDDEYDDDNEGYNLG